MVMVILVLGKLMSTGVTCFYCQCQRIGYEKKGRCNGRDVIYVFGFALVLT